MLTTHVLPYFNNTQPDLTDIESKSNEELDKVWFKSN